MLTLVHYVLWLYFIVMFARVILSWFPIMPGSAMSSVNSFIFSVTEPVLGPVRRALPTVNMGSMGFDLSPVLVLVGIQVLLYVT